MFGFAAQHLPADLAADTAAGPGHQYGFAFQVFAEGDHVKLHRVPVQQVFDLQGPQVLVVDAGLVHGGEEAGQDLDGDVGPCVAAEFRQLVQVCDFHGGDGDDDFLYAFVIGDVFNIVTGAQHGYAVHDLFLFDRIVVDEAHYLPVVPLPQVPQDDVACVPGAYNEDPFEFRIVFLICFFYLVRGPAHKEADSGDKKDVEEADQEHKQLGQHHRSAACGDKKRAQPQMQQHAANVGAHDGQHFFDAGVFPDAAIEFEQVKTDQVTDDVQGNHKERVGDIALIVGTAACKAQDHGQPYRYTECNSIRKEQNNGKHVSTHKTVSLVLIVWIYSVDGGTSRYGPVSVWPGFGRFGF